MYTKPVSTEDPGITRNRLKAMEGGRDINVTSVLLAHINSRSMGAFAATLYTSRLAASATDADLELWQYVAEFFKVDWERVTNHSTALKIYAGIRAVRKTLAYYQCV